MKQFKLILRPIGVILAVQTVFMAVCAAVALYLGEYKSMTAFLQTIAIIIIIDAVIFFASRSARKTDLSLRSGFLLVTFVWVCVSLLGTLPYIFSGSIPNFADALFESVSGFTTTGASVLSDVESLPMSILLWRGLTHWIGGGGIIVLTVAVLPLLGIGGMHLMKAESSGVGSEKLSPRIAETAKYLWFLYLGLTVLAVFLLRLGGMNFIDALCHGFSAVSTGGLSSRNEGIAYFDSPYIQWVITGFMIAGAINFILTIRLIRGQFHYLKNDSEFKAFVMIFLTAAGIISLILYSKGDMPLSEVIRNAAFHTASILSTTGFAATDYELWPAAAQCVLFALFFVGGCSGSTSGGIKVVRHCVLFKHLGRELKRLLHPRGVFIFRINNNPARHGLVDTVAAFFFIFVITLLILTFAVSLSGVSLNTAFFASLSTLSTVGPGFGAVGPTQNYGFFSDYAKYLLSFAMLFGRLEIYTVLVILTPWFWKR
ncbi:MAG: TrkH family potassium uptake protein [Deferribacterales bacterium]|nr:TrkH family potassium uptake protein [Deferribacterales bacterium]